MNMIIDEKKKKFVDCIVNEFGKLETITRKEINFVVNKYSLPWPSWFTADKKFRADRGVFYFESMFFDNDGNKNVFIKPKKTKCKTKKENGVIDINTPVYKPITDIDRVGIIKSDDIKYIPNKNDNFVKWGNCSDLENIIASNMFYPTFITGLSGNGKTFMVQQICAKLKKEMIRVNITIETDEDDLLGGFRLINGETVFNKGPVIEAMERGAILLLDEIDLASNKILCLQPILEGSGIYLKKIGKYISPAQGFNIIATANTKGKGSEKGDFIGTNVLNEAFLDRFAITMEQPYPSEAVEKKILKNTYTSLGIDENQFDFAEKIIKWSNAIRESYYDDVIDDIITTRRLINICYAFKIFNGDKMKAINYAIARFDEDTKTSFLDFYTKIDDKVNIDNENEVEIEKEIVIA